MPCPSSRTSSSRCRRSRPAGSRCAGPRRAGPRCAPPRARCDRARSHPLVVGVAAALVLEHALDAVHLLPAPRHLLERTVHPPASTRTGTSPFDSRRICRWASTSPSTSARTRSIHTGGPARSAPGSAPASRGRGSAGSACRGAPRRGCAAPRPRGRTRARAPPRARSPARAGCRRCASPRASAGRLVGLREKNSNAPTTRSPTRIGNTRIERTPSAVPPLVENARRSDRSLDQSLAGLDHLPHQTLAGTEAPAAQQRSSRRSRPAPRRARPRILGHSGADHVDVSADQGSSRQIRSSVAANACSIGAAPLAMTATSCSRRTRGPLSDPLLELLVGLPQRLLRPVAPGDVGEGDDHAVGVPARRAVRNDAAQEPAIFLPLATASLGVDVASTRSMSVSNDESSNSRLKWESGRPTSELAARSSRASPA